MSRPTSSMWRITTAQGLTMVVDSDTILTLCHRKLRVMPPRPMPRRTLEIVTAPCASPLPW